MLSLILSRWPRYFSHGPAGDMWSVVHFPAALSNTGTLSKFFPSHAMKGSSFCSLSDAGLILTSMLSGFFEGETYTSFAPANPLEGTSGAFGGGDKMNFPEGESNWSLSGSNESFPAIANAVTISGLAMKFIVSLLPSFRAGKFLL